MILERNVLLFIIFITSQSLNDSCHANMPAELISHMWSISYVWILTFRYWFPLEKIWFCNPISWHHPKCTGITTSPSYSYCVGLQDFCRKGLIVLWKLF